MRIGMLIAVALAAAAGGVAVGRSTDTRRLATHPARVQFGSYATAARAGREDASSRTSRSAPDGRRIYAHAQVCLLDEVLGVGDARKHPVADREPQRPRIAGRRSAAA